jgi:hypothetical protein
MVSALKGFRPVRLTTDKVLDERRHFVLLERLDGVADRFTRKEGIRRETFPVASVVHGATHRTDDNRQRDLSAKAGVLGALGVGSTVEEVTVKGGRSRDLGGELGRVSRLNSCELRGVSGRTFVRIKFEEELYSPVGPSAKHNPSCKPASGSGNVNPEQPGGTEARKAVKFC